jgi:hypothetical protein
MRGDECLTTRATHRVRRTSARDEPYPKRRYKKAENEDCKVLVGCFVHVPVQDRAPWWSSGMALVTFHAIFASAPRFSNAAIDQGQQRQNCVHPQASIWYVRKCEGHELCGGCLTNHRARCECHVIYRHHLCCPEFGQGLVQVVDLRGRGTMGIR